MQETPNIGWVLLLSTGLFLVFTRGGNMAYASAALISLTYTIASTVMLYLLQAWNKKDGDDQ